MLTSPIDLGDAATTGAKTAVTATGDLTVHGVTKSVAFPLEAQLTGNNIVVVGSLDVLFSDFGVTAPTSRDRALGGRPRRDGAAALLQPSLTLTTSFGSRRRVGPAALEAVGQRS